MASQTYDHSEFLNLRYYSGTYGNSDATARIQYYGMSGTPNLMFNGTLNMVGASTSDADGQKYMGVIKSRYYDLAPVSVVIDSFDAATGAVSATVTMYSETDSFDGAEDTFHFFLIEDDVAGDNTHITRAVINDGITLSGEGNTATFSGTFTIDPSWTQANLRVVAIVQRQDKEVVQAGSSYAQPDFSIRAMVPFSRVEIVSATRGSFETGDITVMNVGQTETFTIDVVIDTAPPDWTVTFKDSTGTTHTGPFAFGLNEQTSTTFTATVTAPSSGYIEYHFEVTSTNLAKALEIPLVLITDDVEALLVDDDGGKDFEGYFTAALEAAGVSFGVWDLDTGKLNTTVADTMGTLVWSIGEGYPSLDATDRAFLEDYLDAGKRLFITGQDVGWDLNNSQSGNADATFYHDYLHANYIRDDVNLYDVDGIPGDPVSDGIMLHIAGGDGANNQDYPSQIGPYDSDAVEIYSYHGQDWGAAIRSTDSTSGAKLVYLAFGFEAIDNAQDRADVMRGAVYWLNGIVFRDGFESGDTGAWSSSP
jgi:hypothetical protein